MERKLREAEMLNSIACIVESGENKREELEALWKVLLFNQFHDIIPGTSITRVYEDAQAQLKEAGEDARSLYEEAKKKITGPKENGLLVFNSLSWEREELVEIPLEEGEELISCGRLPVSQKTGDQLLIPVKYLPVVMPRLKKTAVQFRKILAEFMKKTDSIFWKTSF